MRETGGDCENYRVLLHGPCAFVSHESILGLDRLGETKNDLMYPIEKSRIENVRYKDNRRGGPGRALYMSSLEKYRRASRSKWQELLQGAVLGAEGSGARRPVFLHQYSWRLRHTVEAGACTPHKGLVKGLGIHAIYRYGDFREGFFPISFSVLFSSAGRR